MNLRAIKLQGTVDKEKKIVLQLPDDVIEGPAEIIVLVSGSRARSQVVDLLQLIAALPSGQLSRLEMDRRREEERRAWE